jgi:hypothetical protein
VKVQEGFAVMKVDGVSYPDDPKARAEAEKTVRAAAEKKALQKYYDGLVTKYAKVDKALLKKLDFEAKKPGIPALSKDQRVLATIPGAKNITVADLTGALVQGFYHGVDNGIKEKKVNRKKDEVFDGLLSRQIIPLQVKADRVTETAEFQRRVAVYEDTVLFSKFIEKAIIPDLKLTDDAVKAYYEQHKKEYTTPAFYKLEGIGFANLKDAQAALDKLRGGTDFKWLNANAEGQLKASERRLNFDGSTLVASGLPKDLAASLASAKKGDFRLYSDPNAQYYTIHVVDVTPAAPAPLSEVQDTIKQALFEEGLTKSIKSWSEKLRKAREVKVFIARIST